jgi:hypothetical protein
MAKPPPSAFQRTLLLPIDSLGKRGETKGSSRENPPPSGHRNLEDARELLIDKLRQGGFLDLPPKKS